MQSDQRQRRVLIFCLSGLGDVIMASPSIAALAAEPERFRLTLLTMFGSVAEYLREQAFTDDVRFVDFLGSAKAKVLRDVWRLRQERFDVSVLAYPHNRVEYNAVARFIADQFRAPRDGLRDHRCRHRLCNVDLARPRRSGHHARGGVGPRVPSRGSDFSRGGDRPEPYRDPAVTTMHVLVGALTLATAFWLTWLAHRDRVGGPAQP